MKKTYYGVKIEKARKEDAEALTDELAPRMRKADREEQEDLGIDPWEAVYGSVIDSEETWTARRNGLLAVFGVSRGMIWMLAAEEAEHHKRAIIACMRDAIGEWLETYGRVFNYITLKNRKALRVIEDMGASFSPPRVFEKTGAEYVRFEIRREPCAACQQP